MPVVHAFAEFWKESSWESLGNDHPHSHTKRSCYRHFGPRKATCCAGPLMSGPPAPPSAPPQMPFVQCDAGQACGACLVELTSDQCVGQHNPNFGGWRSSIYRDAFTPPLTSASAPHLTTGRMTIYYQSCETLARDAHGDSSKIHSDYSICYARLPSWQQQCSTDQDCEYPDCVPGRWGNRCFNGECHAEEEDAGWCENKQAGDTESGGTCVDIGGDMLGWRTKCLEPPRSCGTNHILVRPPVLIPTRPLYSCAPPCSPPLHRLAASADRKLPRTAAEQLPPWLQHE